MKELRSMYSSRDDGTVPKESSHTACVHSVASSHLSAAVCEQVLKASFMGGDVEAGHVAGRRWRCIWKSGCRAQSQ